MAENTKCTNVETIAERIDTIDICLTSLRVMGIKDEETYPEILGLVNTITEQLMYLSNFAINGAIKTDALMAATNGGS